MSKAKSESTIRPRGRPRSETARKAILTAARTLLDQLGPARLTVEAVAQKAGVGKPTIYRYWANAQELAMSALVDQPSAELKAKHGDDNLESLQSLIGEIVDRLNTKRGRQIALMLAGAEPDSELFKAFSNKVILEGRQRGLSILEGAQSIGEIDIGVDPALCIDMLLGAVFLRLLLRHDKLDSTIAKKAVNIVRS